MVFVPAVHHMTSRVTDLERSREFYAGVLGFRVDQAFPGKYRLRLGPGRESPRLVLRPPLAGTPPDDRFSERRIGLDHIAIGVEDRAELERLVGALRQAHVATDGIQPVPGGGALVCFRDPDNIQWEFSRTRSPT